MDSLGHSGGIRLGTDVIEKDRELVAAQTGQRVPRAQALLEPPCSCDQKLVPDLVSKTVIDCFEAIEIEVQHRELRTAPRAAGPVKQVLQPVEEQRDSGDR